MLMPMEVLSNSHKHLNLAAIFDLSNIHSYIHTSVHILQTHTCMNTYINTYIYYIYIKSVI